MSKQNNYVLPETTLIEVISRNRNGKVYKIIMTIEESKEIEKVEGWIYSYYQLGFSSYKNAKEIKQRKKGKNIW